MSKQCKIKFADDGNKLKTQSKKIKCNQCEQEYTKNYFWKHEQLTHGKIGTLQKRKTEKNRCPICTEELNDYLKLKKHLKDVHNYETSRGFLGFEDGPPLVCSHCNKQFQSIDKKDLIDHMKTEHFHTLRPAFNCKLCDKTYTRRDSLMGHIRGIHQKKYECENCGKCFTNLYTKNEHDARNSCGRNLRFYENDLGEPTVEVVPFFVKSEDFFRGNFSIFDQYNHVLNFR